MYFLDIGAIYFFAFLGKLSSRAFVELGHSRPNEDADSRENSGECDNCKGNDPAVLARIKQVLEGIEKAKSKWNNEGEKPLDELWVDLHRVLCVAREIVDELKERTRSLELECEGSNKYLEGRDDDCRRDYTEYHQHH